MRLWVKFLLATGAILLICLVVAGALAGFLIQRAFDRFAQAQESANMQGIVLSLAEYYQVNGSWSGVEGLLTGRRPGMGQGMMGQGMGAGMRLLLLGPDRRVIVDTQDLLTGKKAPLGLWEAATPIIVQGQEVGRLASGSMLSGAKTRTALEATFLRTMLWVLVAAGVVGGLAAAGVATLLALQITAPARDLTRAAQRVAAGDLAQRVAVQSSDELGEVGMAFNDMAAALSRQEELRRQLVADVAHELRTPLSVMRVELESLQDGLTQPTPETIASLGEEVALLSRLVEDLRLLSLMDAGQLSLELQPVTLNAAAQKVAQQVASSAERKGVILELAVPASLPDVRADPGRLQQVLLNLLNNALRHTPAGGTVRLSAQPEGSDLHLQVADTGEGIAPEDLPHVFDRFYRADASRARSSGGTGLGLGIARGLVEAMGGRIWAESAVGQGTTVHVMLPGENASV
jgi:two-component system OmpR family sensor kinase/two-component system sensor histidine kinase BaeS